jgi:hypothetical protein
MDITEQKWAKFETSNAGKRTGFFLSFVKIFQN